jgi:hypothetical protein
MYLQRMRSTALDAMHRNGNRFWRLEAGEPNVLYRVKNGLARGTPPHSPVIDNSVLVR